MGFAIREAVLIIFAILFLSVPSISRGGGKQAVYSKHGSFADLDDIIPLYEAKDATILYAGGLLCGYVSIGVEQKLYGPNEQPKEFSLKLTSSTLRGILDALVEKDPDYFWEMDNQVVNIIPRAQAGKGKYSASILTERLPKFDVSVHQEEPLAGLAVIKLIQIIRESRSNITVSTSANRVDIEDYMLRWKSPKGPSLSVSMINPTIRQALNAIVQADAPSGWDMEYFEDGIGFNVFSSHAHPSGEHYSRKKDPRQLKRAKRKEWRKPGVPGQPGKESKP